MVLAAVVLAAGAGCGGDDDGGSSRTATGATNGNGGEAAGSECERVREPHPRRVRKRSAPSFRPDEGTTYTATVETNCGTFRFRLDEDSPETAGSFVTLAREGFYDGLTFHRIVKGFVVQGGDPLGDGTGDPGYKTREPPPDDVAYSEGVVAMAKGATEPPGTAGSQFFVVTAADAALPPDYAVLGKVTKGFEVVRQIELTPVGADERPVVPIVMKRVRISTS
jgi:peptidyl-prolyl cis-trans isomerase B (cyclophilin B)